MTGYVRRPSGLVVPSDTVKKTREVWTNDEYRLINRIGKLFKARGLRFSLHCDAPDCAKAPMTMERTPDGGSSLTCQCKERIFERR